YVTSGQTVSQPRCKYSHDRVRFVIQANWTSDNFRVCSETFPRLVGKNRDVVFSWNTLVLDKIASHRKCEALHVVVTRTHYACLHHLRLLSGCEVELIASPGFDIFKVLVLPFPIE